MKGFVSSAIVMLATAAMAACGSGPGTSTAPSTAATSPPTSIASAIPPAASIPEASHSASLAPSSSASATGLVGSWHRMQSCDEMRAAFERLGLAQSRAEDADVCTEAGPVEHSHFFTASGGFGSRDESGQQVDDGDYRVVDADTLSFPSHAEEFGYEGDILVDYAIADDVVTFTIQLPSACASSCQDAYAWAASAFASGPWMRGDVP